MTRDVADRPPGSPRRTAVGRFGLAAYQLPPVCLLGHSFGAEVAAAVAATHADAVGALVLAGPTSDPQPALSDR
ncbi:alpha/beta fold hydrolase [Micromonospora sp. CPCC 205558]|uniref:alpha/beta fold hydrolase n=1 Tax=Micromonospora sp. CPCC 205558 TaxID=3122403 RepID=UPI002FF3E056